MRVAFMQIRMGFDSITIAAMSTRCDEIILCSHLLCRARALRSYCDAQTNKD